MALAQVRLLGVRSESAAPSYFNGEFYVDAESRLTLDNCTSYRSGDFHNSFISKKCSPWTENGSVSVDDHASTSDSHSKRWKLAHNLDQVIHDASALLHFTQFMDERGHLNLVKFLLHVESFKASAVSAMADSSDKSLAMLKDDAGYIFAEFIGQNAPHAISVTDELRNRVIDQVCGVNGTIDTGCFDEVQRFVLRIAEERFFNEFRSSVFYAKHRLDVFSRGEISLADVLKSEQLLLSFVEFMEAEEEQKLIEFIIAVDTFALQFSCNGNDQLAMDDAIVIYDKYISMQAIHPLQFGPKVRVQVESDICSESGQPSIDCFKDAKLLAVSIIEQNYLRRFLSSVSFEKYMMALVERVNNNCETSRLTQFRDKARSYSSLIQSPDILQSPLVLPLDQKSHAQNCTIFEFPPTSSSVPSVSLTDDDECASQPDSFSSYSSLSAVRRCQRLKSKSPLATIDYLGRYQPKYDKDVCMASDQKSARKRVKSTWNRYFKTSSAKDLELADQVAQLIIADVHNMVSVGNLSNLPKE